MGEQEFEAFFHPACDHAGLSAPKQAVVDEDGVGFCSNRSFNQRAAGGDAGYDFANLRFALDLQAVGAVVGEAFGLQQGVEGGE